MSFFNARRLAAVSLAAAAALSLTGCELNSEMEPSKNIAKRIIDHTDKVCVERGGTANIAWMEGRIDDVVITCKDGTNHFYDG